MPAVLIILAVLIVAALYLDRGEKDNDRDDDPEQMNRSSIVDPRL
jgi:hypothetical protein